MNLLHAFQKSDVTEAFDRNSSLRASDNVQTDVEILQDKTQNLPAMAGRMTLGGTLIVDGNQTLPASAWTDLLPRLYMYQLWPK
jgi:hypothetical protein